MKVRGGHDNHKGHMIIIKRIRGGIKVTGYCCGRAKWLFLTWCY